MKCQTSYQVGGRYSLFVSHARTHTASSRLKKLTSSIYRTYTMQHSDGLNMKWNDNSYMIPDSNSIDWYVNAGKWISSRKADLTWLLHAVNQQPHQPKHGSNRTHMQLCGLGLNPAAIITELWYCHYSIFPTLWLPLLSSGLRKECKIAFQSQEKQRFSHRAWSWKTFKNQCCMLTAVTAIMKNNPAHGVANQWKITLPIVPDFEEIFD